MVALRSNQSSYWNIAGSIAASTTLWLIPVFAKFDLRYLLATNSLALGASIYGCSESIRLLKRNKHGSLEELISNEVAQEWVDLEADRRKSLLRERYGLIDAAQPIEAEPEPEAEWVPINPFEHGGAFPVEDLAQTLATATNSGTLIIAPSGCGKTRLLQNAISKAHQHYKGMVDFQIIDCKGEEDGWLGIESSPNDYCLLDDDTAREGFGQLMVMKGQLKRIDTTIPMIAIIDEWNNGVSSLTNSPEISKPEKQTAISAGRQIVTKGRSKRLFGWMTTHTPETDSIGMDGATRQSFNIVILARGNKLGLISSVLKNTYKFVDDDTTREKLLVAYQHFMSNGDAALKEKPVALTNLCGEWRLVRLPQYENPDPIERTVLDGGDSDPLEPAAEHHQEDVYDQLYELWQADPNADLAPLFQKLTGRKLQPEKELALRAYLKRMAAERGE
jgi:hypothetical protein